MHFCRLARSLTHFILSPYHHNTLKLLYIKKIHQKKTIFLFWTLPFFEAYTLMKRRLSQYNEDVYSDIANQYSYIRTTVDSHTYNTYNIRLHRKRNKLCIKCISSVIYRGEHEYISFRCHIIYLSILFHTKGFIFLFQRNLSVLSMCLVV